jgi:hypothetical protein
MHYVVTFDKAGASTKDEAGAQRGAKFLHPSSKFEASKRPTSFVFICFLVFLFVLVFLFLSPAQYQGIGRTSESGPADQKLSALIFILTRHAAAGNLRI